MSDDPASYLAHVPGFLAAPLALIVTAWSKRHGDRIDKLEQATEAIRNILPTLQTTDEAKTGRKELLDQITGVGDRVQDLTNVLLRNGP